MSIAHLDAAFKCRKFKGAARLLLLALANRASDGKPRRDGKIVPIGWSYAGGGRLMSDINASRDTVIDTMKILVDAKVVQRRRRLGSASWSFVDIEALQKLAYTEEDIAEFRKRWDAKVGKSTTTGQSDEEKALPPKSGNSTTTDVGKTTITDVGEIPTTVGGNSPAYNPKLQSKGCNTKGLQPSVSESELADSDYDSATTAEQSSSLPTVCKRQNDQDHSSDSEVENRLLKSGDVIPASDKGRASPPSLQDDPEPDPKEYVDIVYLCSLWWSTHGNPLDDIETSPISEVHPWGHPRTWTPVQRREAFLAARQNDLNSEEPVPDDDSEPEPEPEADPAKKEEALLRDEQYMLDIYLKEGRDVVADLLIWLPKSDFWYTRITSLAKLKTDFDAVCRSYQKYLQKAEDNGSDIDCEDYVYGVFLESGGGATESICWERLHPLPAWDPQDAAEEQAADAYDDEFGVTVRNPWAEEDYNAAMAELEAKGMVDDPADPWSDEEAGDPADVSAAQHANDSGKVGDAESEPPRAHYCEDCDSVHAGTCIPGDLE
jgi:hypothetical protein